MTSVTGKKKKIGLFLSFCFFSQFDSVSLRRFGNEDDEEEAEGLAHLFEIEGVKIASLTMIALVSTNIDIY
ncbi:unnamed protein product [Adineta ricciae]|uniref:Uncharacterized protein n=1 Tax=Adineta ricciae TaxID=249248 RepID=A0A813PF55_ADIRI|nr:unnamed protein product [Adineta ricciae]